MVCFCKIDTVAYKQLHIRHHEVRLFHPNMKYLANNGSLQIVPGMFHTRNFNLIIEPHPVLLVSLIMQGWGGSPPK
jgi:hypothetical protein